MIGTGEEEAPGGTPPERYAARLGSARAGLEEVGSGVLLVGAGADLRWLTGYVALPSERLTLLVLAPWGTPRLVVPRLELARAEGGPAVQAGHIEAVSWEETEDPFRRVADLLGPLPAGRSLLVSDRLWTAFLLRFQALYSAAPFDIASRLLAPLREIKDREEVDLLRTAAHAADRTILALAGGRLVGRSESDVAREVRERLVDEGHDEAGFAIVAGGPNSASPHHEPSERILGGGEALVLDIGGTVDGYGSDITRTLWLTGGDAGAGPDEAFGRLFAVLEAAQAAALSAVRPRVSCEAIDAVARDAITEAGFGEHFIHRTGHGIGLEGHEEPYLVAGNTAALRPGHAFSVEPGIYLEGRYGARIEDIVVCTADGGEVLNVAPRGLAVVSGL